MNWLKRILGAAAPVPQVASARDAWESVRAGFDCEKRGDSEGAAQCYRAALDGDSPPPQAQALYYLGRLAAEGGREEEAIALFHDAVDRCPDEALYQLALADALLAARRYPEAATAYEACRALQPEASVMANNYAAALVEMNRRGEARVELERLREIAPYSPEIHFNLGGIYREYCRTSQAIESYRRALELRPGHAPTFSNLLLELNMSASLSAQEIFEEHRRYGESVARRYAAPAPDRAWPRRLRIGYVSADFRNHVVSFFLEPVLARHDHARFEIFCYHTHHQKDRVTAQLRPLADRWIDCEDMQDSQLAARIRDDRIDILIDLNGHTADNRLLVFAEKPAPVQATYLGYPNTTGMETVDYRITDRFADPPGKSDRLNSERLVRLPNSHFCFRPGEDAPPVEPLPADSAGTVTFGCFCHFAKISAPFLDTVARVLAAVPGSRFMLKGRPLSNPEVGSGVLRHFERSGVDLARVELRGWEPSSRSHLRIYGAVDIALDSFPYTGATTTCEALWMGVPVVTLAGDRHAGRMCTSILSNVGLAEWVARDKDEYVAKCVALSGDLPRLAHMRRTMRERMRASPLMDEAGFIRDLERCYTEMWERSVLAVVPEVGADAQTIRALTDGARALRQSGRRIEAVDACLAILEQAPAQLETLELLWDIGFEAGIPGIAIDPLVKSINLRGDNVRLHYMLGCALQAQGKAADAVVAFRRTVEIDPVFAKAHNNLGCVLEATGQFDEAARCYAAAVALDATLAQAHYNAGSLQYRLGDRAGAMAHLEQAAAIAPGNAAWRCRLGEMRLESLRIDDAIADFRAAVDLDPSIHRVHSGLGAALLLTGRVEEALAALRQALALDPSDSFLASRVLQAQQFRGGDANALYQEHVAWARRYARALVRLSTRALTPLTAGGRLNIGYVSPDFVAHPAAFFIEPVLAAHDRSAVKVFCYSTSGREDDTTRRLKSLDCAWRDISGLPDFEAADRIRADGIDILVDLAGHIDGGRLLLFAQKPAPVQVTWLGYPATTGLSAVDYRLTDWIADPEGASERFHTEHLLRLPDGFHCYSPPADAPPIVPPAQLGTGHVTFASFNNLAKLTLQAIALWSRLLRELPRSRLILKAHGFAAASARKRVAECFAAHGIAVDRLDLLRAEPLHARHLAKYHDVDVALDVFPYNGVTTTCEALWMGVPVVTLAGANHAGRVGASILHSVGLAQCVAETEEQYVEIALQLAHDPAGRREFRAGARERMRSSSLLDGTRFARELESAYRRMWEEKSRAVAASPEQTAAAQAGVAEEGLPPALRLHVGGEKRKAGWTILNIKPGPDVDHVGDCSDLTRFADASVDEIYASHVLEHLGYQEMLPRALGEFHRVLRPGGLLSISVPDFEVLCRLFINSARTKVERLHLMRIAFGGQMDPHDFHYVGLTFEILNDFLSQAGFARVDRVAEIGLFEDDSTLRFGETLISLNVIARK